MNQYESAVHGYLGELDRLLEQATQFRGTKPDKAQVDAWAKEHQPLFESFAAQADPWLTGHWEPLPKIRPKVVEAWTSAAVGGDPKFEWVHAHSDKINPLFAQHQWERLREQRKAWDVALQELWQLARSCGPSPAFVQFREYVETRLREPQTALTRSDLKRELGKTRLSWEEKQALKALIDGDAAPKGRETTRPGHEGSSYFMDD